MNAAQPPLFTPERWRELRALLDRLDALPANERAQELDRLADVDAELAQAARALDSTDDADNSKTVPLAESAPDMPAQVGPFRLLHQIGAGGMGFVYLAERSGSDFTQRVALKLLDGRAGNAARLAARERNILATLTHPNITAFVDAGSESGCAWLAMEYVDGEPMAAWCERRGLDIRARVQLFDQVCAAVVYAHSQLVVHRDLKPSNVLVTRDGTVKLLDFGIALILDSSRENAPSTRVFTPEYAAPEQLRGERVSTATDVYALGLILYELVCGKRLPTFGHCDEWTTTELASYGTSGTHAEPPPHADRRQGERLMRGDLGRIIAHALTPDPAHRYPSAALLREDLQRWLEHRPLGIRRHGIAYVATHFARRHRAAAVIALAAVVALIATSGFALWQAREARLMAARAEHAKTFLAGLFTDANPYNLKRNGATTTDLLREAARRIDQEFADAPVMQIELRATIVEALTRLEPKLARELAQRNVDQARRIHGDRAPQTGSALGGLALATEETGDIDGARTEFADAYAILRDAGERYARDRIGAMTGLAKMANRRDDYAEAQRWHEAVLHEREAREGPQSADIAMDLMNLSADLAYQEHFAQGEVLAQRSHAMLVSTLGPEHPRNIYVDNALGLAQIDMGHYDAAVSTLGHAVDVARRTLPPSASMTSGVQISLAYAESCAGNDEAAIALLHDVRQRLTATNDPQAGTAELRLGLAELRMHPGDALQTLDAGRAHLAAAVSRIAGDNRKAAWAQAAYGDALAISGDAANGERIAREARSQLLTGKEAGKVTLAEIDRLLADVLDRENAAAEARTLREEALSIYARVYGPEHPRMHALAQEIASAAHR